MTTSSITGITMRLKPVSMGLTPRQSVGLLKFARWTAISIVLVYFIRGTVLPWYLHVPYSIWIGLTILALSVGAGAAVIGGGKWRWGWVAVLCSFAASIFLAEQPISAGLHWFGIVLLVLAVGPVIPNPIAVRLRFIAWEFLTMGLTTLTGIFVIWYLLHLPSFGGMVYFTGFMNQSMLLGPIAGMGVAIALARAIHGRSWKWAVVATLGLIPLLASGSRVAACATGVAVCLLLFRRKPVLGGICALVFPVALYAMIALGHQEEEGGSFTGALAHKGMENSRTDLWRCRIDEFVSSPIIGIGVAMGTGSGSEQDSKGDIRVEPGSSYLALLAMTGAVGTLAFFSALAYLLYRFSFATKGAGLEMDILSVVGIYMAVHGVAEGWILGFGSPLCFIFWLWLGRFADVALKPARAVIKQPVRNYRRFRYFVPVPSKS